MIAAKILFEYKPQKGYIPTQAASMPEKTVNLSEKTISGPEFAYSEEILRYQLKTINLPNWMKPEKYPENHTKWRYYQMLGGSENWPELWFRKLSSLTTEQEYICVQLLNTRKFRSNFRQSLKTQLLNWLNHEFTGFKTPFSLKQWESIIRPYTKEQSEKIFNRAEAPA